MGRVVQREGRDDRVYGGVGPVVLERDTAVRRGRPGCFWRLRSLWIDADSVVAGPEQAGDVSAEQAAAEFDDAGRGRGQLVPDEWPGGGQPGFLAFAFAFAGGGVASVGVIARGVAHAGMLPRVNSQSLRGGRRSSCRAAVLRGRGGLRGSAGARMSYPRRRAP